MESHLPIRRGGSLQITKDMLIIQLQLQTCQLGTVPSGLHPHAHAGVTGVCPGVCERI